MAKGQKRGNRETRKPKSEKPKPVATATTGLTKGIAASTPAPKKR